MWVSLHCIKNIIFSKPWLPTFRIHSWERTSRIQNCVPSEIYVDVEKYDPDITAGYFTKAALQFPLHNHFSTQKKNNRLTPVET
jgi:hypothetical protein